MEWVVANSSNIKTFGYEEDTNTLFVQFKNGALYKYNGVPKIYFMNMKSAESTGRYFAVVIKPGFEGGRVYNDKLLKD